MPAVKTWTRMRGGIGLALATPALCGAALTLTACRDLSGFDTHGDSYQGPVINAPFILAGFDGGSATMCLTLDTDHLQESPGTVSTSDGRFHASPMRTIPQLWHDPLSTLSFGDGRLKNLMYVVRATSPFTDGNGNDVFAVVSLMQAGDIEVRLLRGAPLIGADGGTADGDMQNVFAVFDLTRQSGPCSY
jgi:hypothetical protein